MRDSLHAWLFVCVTIVGAALFASAAVAQQPPPALQAAPHLRVELLQTLAQNWPRYEIYMESTAPSAAVTALQRAGIVSVAGSSETCYGRRLHLFMTQYGERVAAEHGWSLAGGSLDIPVGRLVPLDASQVLQLHGTDSYLSMNFRFEGNANVRYLETLGKPAIWTISALPEMNLTLEDVNKTLSSRIPIVHDRFEGWIPMPGWHSETTLCSD